MRRFAWRFGVPIAAAVLLVLFYGAYLIRVRDFVTIHWHRALDAAFFVLVVFVVALWLRMVAGVFYRWYAHRIAARTHSTIDDRFVPLARKVTGVLIWVVALAIVLAVLGVNVSALIATLGVGSLAIALAAQDTIANVIAGFLIMIDRPFRVGDDIQLPSGERVRVKAIGNRRSTFTTADGAILIMPNVDISKSKIVNYTAGAEPERS